MLIFAWVFVSPATYGDTGTTANSFGRSLTEKDLDQLPAHIWPDGRGLPEGQGAASDGMVIYRERCAGCHGGNGEGGSAIELVGDRESLNSEFPDKGIAVYWPWAPTLFQYIRRAMPPDAPWSLDINETYAVVAYVLKLNELLPADTLLDREGLSAVVMPNRGGFDNQYPVK